MAGAIAAETPPPRINWFWRGALHALSFPAWTVSLALVGVGSLARDVGHPVSAAMLSTLLIWAGPAQVLFYGGIAAGLAMPAIAVAISISSIRFLPMTMTILPMIRKPGHGLLLQALAAHYMAVTVWSENLRRLPSVPEAERMSYFLGFGNACLWLATLATGAGYYLMGAVPLPFAAGLLFLTPIFFTVSVTAGARGVPDWLAIVLGFALEPLAIRLVGESVDLLVVGLVGGTIAFAVGRIRAGRARPAEASPAKASSR